MSKVMIVDGNWVSARAFFSPRYGENHTTYHFFVQILKYFPNYEIHVVWDTANGTKTRRQIDPKYKSERQPISDEFYIDIDIIKVILRYMGISSYFADGYEGDDLLYTLANDFVKKGREVVIFSIDKDLRQAITNNITVITPKDGEIDKAWLKEEWNLTPEQIPYILAIAGDSVDGVVGIRGIGWKTATKIVNDEHISERIQSLIDDKENQKKVEVNLKLVTLQDVPSEDIFIIEGKLDEEQLRYSFESRAPSLWKRYLKAKENKKNVDVEDCW